MAELPELTILQRQMDEALRGKAVASVEVTQEKCINVPVDAIVGGLVGKTITEVTRKGKWLYIHIDSGDFLLINLGMGADLWHYANAGDLPPKYQFRLGLNDGTGFTCRFWWFGYIRFLSPEGLSGHKETEKLGPSPLELDFESFAAIASRYPRSSVKSLILDQDKLSGIGNAYAHDILWKARLHPQRRLGSLSSAELRSYYEGIRWALTRAIELGGVEDDFYRQGGNHRNWESFAIVGYKEGKLCPECSSAIEKIKTGTTATFICPKCQPI